MGRSKAGKTSLTRALQSEDLLCAKAQFTDTSGDTIDSPREYAKTKNFSVGLACCSFEAGVVVAVQAADELFIDFGHQRLVFPSGVCPRFASLRCRITNCQPYYPFLFLFRIFILFRLMGNFVFLRKISRLPPRNEKQLPPFRAAAVCIDCLYADGTSF